MPDRSCVTEINATVYTNGLTNSAFDLQCEASLKAVTDAGLKPSEIDGVFLIDDASGTPDDFIENFGIGDLHFPALVPQRESRTTLARRTREKDITGPLTSHEIRV